MKTYDYRICRTDDDLLQFNVHGFFKWNIKVKKVLVIDRAIAICILLRLKDQKTFPGIAKAMAEGIAKAMAEQWGSL